jgi:hypothetical protein
MGRGNAFQVIERNEFITGKRKEHPQERIIRKKTAEDRYIDFRCLS